MQAGRPGRGRGRTTGAYSPISLFRHGSSRRDGVTVREQSLCALAQTMMHLARYLVAAALLCAGVAQGDGAPAFAALVSAGQELAVTGAGNERFAASSVRVNRIDIRGNRALSSTALRVVAAPYLARQLTEADIGELREALTRRYTDHGYLNSRVVLDPEAPFQDGVLSFLVLEGRIKEVRVTGAGDLRPSYVIGRVRPQQDEALNSDLLRERLQRLAEDPLFKSVNSHMEVEDDPREAIVDIDVVRARPYSFSLAVNNYRPPSIGEKGFDLSGQVHNLTGYGDLLNADLSGPVDSSGGLGYGVAWQLPMGYEGGQLSLSAAKINTVFTQQPLSALAVSSTIERQELKATQVLWNSGGQQFSIGASFAHETESTAGDQKYSQQSGADQAPTHALTARLIPEYSYRSDRQYLNVWFTFLHAHLLDYVATTPSAALADENYFVWTGQLRHLLQFPSAPFEVETRALLQRTDARISELHEQEIGGINSVRGFEENAFLASNVQSINCDVRWLHCRLMQRRGRV